jgi:CRP/FNR family transcriptional regulator
LTHQELAERLGTSREIVSRILGSFELQGLVELGRRQIQLLDPRALLEIASPTQG